MRISNLHIKGFRNFVDESIDFDEKTLIVGGNDTGKSNLLYALRILFDSNLSQKDLELSDSDYCIYSDDNLIEITAKLEDISEDCVNSALQGAIKDSMAFIRYSLSKGADYEICIGHDLNALAPCSGRTYIKNLTVEYVGSGRDLSAFLKRQQNKLLDIARNQRDESEENEDAISLDEIQGSLKTLNESISSLHYVADSLDVVNDEMSEISIGHEGYTARLVAGNTDAGKLLDNLRLAYLRGDSPLVFGGDGRSNQLYFATWIAEQRLTKRPEKVIVFAIEEPEAHLHPHQQRRLAEYLSTVMEGQVLMTTHSPQIVEKFNNGRILRLCNSRDKQHGSQALGCNASVDAALEKMGYRLNAVSSEVFFSSGVLLVEGPSERMLYIALAYALGKNVDRLNISILSVDGVGFKPYVRVCEELGIPYALRTDNDIFKVKGKDAWRCAGVARLIDIAREFCEDADVNDLISSSESKMSWSGSPDVPESAQEAMTELIPALREHGLFLSDNEDLEADLISSPLADQLTKYFEQPTPQKARDVMQKRKAENMHLFIESAPDLTVLKSHDIVAPLNYIITQVESRES